MPDRVPPSNAQARIDRLLRDYHAYNAQIEETRIKARSLAHEKAETVARLREMMSAADVAELLGVSPAAVFAMLKEAQ